MTVRLYRSTDASAPVLTGQVGSLITLLDAVLVNGYGSQTAAGWTKPYSGTNTAVYRMATSGNTGFYLDVLDNAPSTAREARMRGYETMTAVSTGTGPFPTAAQSSFANICRKSASADATARAWYCIADGSCFYLFTDTGDVASYSFTYHFGDFFSYASADAYRCCNIGRTAENNGATNAEMLPYLYQSASAINSSPGGHYAARHWTGVGGSLPFAKHTSLLASGGSGTYVMGSGASLLPYPNGADSGLQLAPLYVGHTVGLRGYLKGFWCPLHFQPLGHGDTFSGTGNMAGKSFIALNVLNSNPSQTLGQVVVEYSDTWS